MSYERKLIRALENRVNELQTALVGLCEDVIPYLEIKPVDGEQAEIIRNKLLELKELGKYDTRINIGPF
jgi:hypothetical protein